MYSGEGKSSQFPSSSSTSNSTSDIKQRWKEIQYSLKQRLITEDDVEWKLPTSSSREEDDQVQVVLKYIGGVDVSCVKEDQSIACGTLVVLDFQTSKVVYQGSAHVKLDVPYIAGFLAFREAPVLLHLLEKMKDSNSTYYPQLVMVDGNGILHPRGFGLACHLGVLANLPTIGIGKKLHIVDGLTERGVRKCLEDNEKSGENFIKLTGHSGRVYGAAMRSTEGSVKPIFISIGHRLSLDTAIKIVKMTCKYRVPEPIRQADKRSRGYVQKPQQVLRLNCLNLETLSGNHLDSDLSGNAGEGQNGLAGIGRGTLQGRGRGCGRGRGQGRGGWKEKREANEAGTGRRVQESGCIEGKGEVKSTGRGYEHGRGKGIGRLIGQGRGRGRCNWGNKCEYAWVPKESQD